MGNYEHPKLSQQKQNQAEAKERKQDGLFENRRKGSFLSEFGGPRISVRTSTFLFQINLKEQQRSRFWILEHF